MIAMKFHIPLDEVENRSINEYRLMRFTVVNTASLESGMGGFRYQTDDEEYEEFEELIEHYQGIGLFN